jgi:hypothetical protein
MSRTTTRSCLLVATITGLGLTTIGCSSSSSRSCGLTADGKIVYTPTYQPGEPMTLASGDAFGRNMFEQGVVLTSRAHADLRYAGVAE